MILRLFPALALAAVLSFGPAFGQEGKSEAAHEEKNLDAWKWLNFAMLAGGLGYLLSKSLPSFFKTRTDDIQKGIREATEIRQQAEARAAEMDQRMANLSSEIENLRRTSNQGMSVEGERIRKETADHLAKIQAQAENEINGATKAARHELKALSAQLAIQLAEQKVRARLDPPTQDSLVDNFIADIERTSSN